MNLGKLNFIRRTNPALFRNILRAETNRFHRQQERAQEDISRREDFGFGFHRAPRNTNLQNTRE